VRGPEVPSMHARGLNMSSEYVIEGGTSLAADTFSG
jgi:hypothetical protein